MEHELIYKFRFSRRVWLLTALYVVIFGVLAAALYFLYEGGYLSAWFSSCIVALLLLMSLSIPRKICLNRERLRIDCLMDITELPLNEIASVRKVERSEMKGIIPLLGGFGFFGYYGHYHNHLYGKFRMFATDLSNLYLIRTAKGNYVIGCSNPELITKLRDMIQK